MPCKYTPKFVRSFWSRVRKRRKDGCWEWQGYRTKSGYGMLQCRSISQQPMYAHRVAWELVKGKIPNGKHVLHECDNPACCRPSHHFLGTQVDNNLDRDKKGRTASGDRNGSRTRPDRVARGEANGVSVLTERTVRRIRRLWRTGRYTQREIANLCNSKQQRVSKIVRREDWSHLR